MNAQVHISSLVVHGRPAGIASIESAIRGLAGAEVHGVSKQGKLVVTLETISEAGMVEQIAAINQLEGVLSVALIFHQVEDSTDSA